MRRLAPAVAVLMLLGLTTPASGGIREDLEQVTDAIADLEAQIAAAESQAGELSGEITSAKARLDQLVEDLELAEADLELLADEIGEAERTLRTTRDDLDARYASIDSTERTIQAIRVRANTQIVAAYMRGATEVPFAVIASDDVVDVALVVEYSNQASNQLADSVRELESLELELQRQAGAIAEKEAEIVAQVEQLRATRERLERVAADVEERKRAVAAELSVQQTLLSTVQQEINHFESELDGLAAEQARLEELIRQSQSNDGTAPGVLTRPVPGRVTSPFGTRVHPILGTKKLHTGMDFSGAYGQTIVAAGDGTVIHAAPFGGYGNTVIIDHGGGMATLYAHQSSLAVALGEAVSAGQKVGAVGSTGLSTGPHLHFEVRINGSPVDPAPYL